MKTSDAIKQFNNSVGDLAEALGITREAIYQWGENVPLLRAYQIRELYAVREKLGASETAQTEKEAA